MRYLHTKTAVSAPDDAASTVCLEKGDFAGKLRRFVLQRLLFTGEKNRLLREIEVPVPFS
jgi:hypothetical protein